MKEYVEVVVKVGLTGSEGKLIFITTTNRENIRYDTLDYGATGFYRLQIKNACVMDNKNKEWNIEYGKDYYRYIEEDLWVIERPHPIEFFITRTKNRNDRKESIIMFDKGDERED